MSKITFVSLSRLKGAIKKVSRELEFHGFLDDAVDAVPVYWVPAGGAHGWQGYGWTGCIYVPAVSVMRIYEKLRGTYTSLADVVRHEYGHAVADTHRGLIRSREFSGIFGGSHDSFEMQEFDGEVHVSGYAAKNSAEDFAEVFMCYLRHKGRLPAELNYPTIRQKWAFVRRLGRAIQDGRRRWY